MDQVPTKFLRDYTALVPRLINLVNLSANLLSKSMDWFLYDMDLRHERVKKVKKDRLYKIQKKDPV